MQSGPHRPELDNMTPSQIRVVCEQLLYTMDFSQRIKFATELPGLYKKIEGSIPDPILEQKAIQMATEMKNSDGKTLTDRCCDALKLVGL